jgi:hypothetical protein
MSNEDMDENDILGIRRFSSMRKNFIWNRRLPTEPQDKYFNITGHNITNYFKDKAGYDESTKCIINQDTGVACIDTGAFIDENQGVDYGGLLTAISFPTLDIIQQKNIEYSQDHKEHKDA